MENSSEKKRWEAILKWEKQFDEDVVVFRYKTLSHNDLEVTVHNADGKFIAKKVFGL